MRATLHLVTADDCLVLRPLMQPVLDAELARHRELGPPLVGLDLDPILSSARRAPSRAAASPGRSCAPPWPNGSPTRTPRALSYACRNLLPLVQVPPRGVWGRTARSRSTTAESWLGRPLVEQPFDRRGGAALLRRVRPGHRGGRGVVVAPGRYAAGGRATPPSPPGLPGRGRAASSSTSRTVPVPIPTPPARRGSSPSTTTSAVPCRPQPHRRRRGAARSSPRRRAGPRHGALDGMLLGPWHLGGTGRGDGDASRRPRRPTDEAVGLGPSGRGSSLAGLLAPRGHGRGPLPAIPDMRPPPTPGDRSASRSATGLRPACRRPSIVQTTGNCRIGAAQERAF